MSTYLESLRDGLTACMEASEEVVVLGEDLLDPYGGAFKVTQGLSTRFPDRILPTPISEGAIVGVGTGLAMRGFKPVVEIMFGDFLTLCTDQLVNSATKFPLMYRGKVQVPLVVRTPMGAGRGYGPTHSQSIEKMFFGVPGLKVVAPSHLHDPGELLSRAITEETEPVLFVENKLLYGTPLGSSHPEISVESYGQDYPTLVAQNFSGGAPDAIVIGYGGACLPILSVLEEMVDEEIRLRAVLPSWVNRGLPSDLLPVLSDCNALIVAEEATSGFNWGSEIAASLYELLLPKLDRPIRRLASEADVVPAAKPLEQEMLLNRTKLKEAIFAAL